MELSLPFAAVVARVTGSVFVSCLCVPGTRRLRSSGDGRPTLSHSRRRTTGNRNLASLRPCTSAERSVSVCLSSVTGEGNGLLTYRIPLRTVQVMVAVGRVSGPLLEVYMNPALHVGMGCARSNPQWASMQHLCLYMALSRVGMWIPSPDLWLGCGPPVLTYGCGVVPQS